MKSFRGRRIISNVSVVSRLSLVALLVTLFSLLITAGVGLRRGDDLVSGVMRDQMVTIGASRATDVSIYVRNIRREVAGLGLSPGTASAIEELSAAARELEDGEQEAGASATLTEYYVTDVVPELQRVRRAPVSAAPLIPISDAAIYLQNAYTIPKTPGGDESKPIAPPLVDDAADGSEYSAVHARIHSSYRSIGLSSGFEDLFLIDAETETVVYSARKRIDFATSLAVGPHSGSTLASLITNISSDPHPGEAVITDFSPYTPAFDEPTAFVASPVMASGGSLVGYIAVAFSLDEMNSILTGDGSWDIFGDTAETYVAASDSTMRSNARSYVEDPVAYLAVDSSVGKHPFLSDNDRESIRSSGTTALIQPVNRRVIEAAANGTGTMITTNYAGVDVLTAYSALDIEGVEWVLFAEMSVEQFDAPLNDYARDLVLAVALFVVSVTFIAVRWSGRLMAPVKSISRHLRAIRANRGDDWLADNDHSVSGSSPDEYLVLQSNIDDMLERLASRRSEMEARSAERVNLVEQFLPAAVARRAEATNGEVLDHVPYATVVVLVLQGLGTIVHDRSERDGRELVGRFVDDADGLAAEFGLERIKTTGDAYYAVCGVSRPFLDHAPRSVSFALAAKELALDIARESETEISVAAGLDSGPVSVGLTSRTGLVYDSWGPAVTRAAGIARNARAGDIAVSQVVREHLPEEFNVESDEPGRTTFVVTDRTTDEARS